MTLTKVRPVVRLARNLQSSFTKCRSQINVSRIHARVLTAASYPTRSGRGTSDSAHGRGRCFSTSNALQAVHSCPYPDVHIPDNVPFAHHVMEHFGRYGDRIALVNGVTGQTFTYGQLQKLITRVASALSKMGLRKGDVVTMCSPNCPEYPIMFLAVASLGAVVSAVNPLYTAAELGHQLKDSESCLLVTVPEIIATAKKATADCPNVKEIIVFGDASGCRPFSNLVADDGTAYTENVDINVKEDMLALPYSSGTTGLPKGVMLTHHNVISNIEQLCSEQVMDYHTGETLVGVLPYFHIYGQVVVLFSGLSRGVKNITLPRFDPELYLKVVQEHRATFLHVVPPMALFLAKHPLVAKYDFSSVHTIFTGAAPLGNELAEELLTRINVPAFRQGYGLTECSPVTHSNPKTGFKFGSIGTVIPNTQSKIVDIESGQMLGLGENGELCIKGPQVMKGYFKRPEATADTLDEDGWLHTGDIGHFDEDGHVFIVDRLKELIKYKGFQVAPAELEALLITHPAVLDAAVVGVPDQEAGELPRAYIVRKPKMTVSESDVASFIESKLAPHKKLRGGVEFRDEIPKSPSGKILRRMLKQELLNGR